MAAAVLVSAFSLAAKFLVEVALELTPLLLLPSLRPALFVLLLVVLWASLPPSCREFAVPFFALPSCRALAFLLIDFVVLDDVLCVVVFRVPPPPLIFPSAVEIPR